MTALLEVEDLSVTFPVQKQMLHAVRRVGFTIEEGEAIGIVGESGSGKSTVATAITQLSPGKVTGKILFKGQETVRPGVDIGMIFQDPMSSLNPTMRIGEQIIEGPLYHKLMNRDQAKKKAIELLRLVGVEEAEARFKHYPHQFSGGMRQRVLIAIALICSPHLLIADEPTTALDIGVQKQIIELLAKMKDLFSMSLLLISHDFNVVAACCEKVLVMYAGKIVESGLVKEVLENPRHPYTQMLINAVPSMDRPKNIPLAVIEGAPPNLLKLPIGCAFKERCPYAANKCNEQPPGPVACWRAL